MALAADDDPGSTPALRRTCHVCQDAVESHVWYAKTIRSEEDEKPHRVYACPDCFFELEDDERTGYYRERV